MRCPSRQGATAGGKLTRTGNALQWEAERNPFCAYASHYSIDFFALEASRQPYPLTALRDLGYLEVLDSLPPAGCATAATALAAWCQLGGAPAQRSHASATKSVSVSRSVRNVLLADVRDTLFQGDPFNPDVLPVSNAGAAAQQPGEALPYVLFSEEGNLTTRVTVGSQNSNRHWVCPQPRPCPLLPRRLPSNMRLHQGREAG